MKKTLFLFLAALVSSCAPVKDKPVLTIGVVTDIHYCRDREPSKNRYYSLSADKLSEAVKYFNRQKVDFTVSLGDTFDPDMRSYQDLEAEFSKLRKPLYKLLGNHDCIAPYGSARMDSVMAVMGIDNPYYAFSTGKGYRCIFIDGNDISIQSTAPGSAGREKARQMLDALKAAGQPMARNYNGMLSEEQTEWLVSQIESAAAAGEEVLVFGHMPLLPRDIRAAQWDGEQIDSLLQAHANVKAVFAGHHHEGAHVESGHIVHHTFKGMIDGTQNSFGIIRVYKDRLEIEDF